MGSQDAEFRARKKPTPVQNEKIDEKVADIAVA
jgi:hypothetical protein